MYWKNVECKAEDGWVTGTILLQKIISKVLKIQFNLIEIDLPKKESISRPINVKEICLDFSMQVMTHSSCYRKALETKYKTWIIAEVEFIIDR